MNGNIKENHIGPLVLGAESSTRYQIMKAKINDLDKNQIVSIGLLSFISTILAIWMAVAIIFFIQIIMIKPVLVILYIILCFVGYCIIYTHCELKDVEKHWKWMESKGKTFEIEQLVRK